MSTDQAVASSIEERQLRDTVREFCEDEVAPHVREFEEAKRFPDSLYRKFGELGLLAVTTPESYGGAGMGYMQLAWVVEEVARICPGVALSVAATNSLSAGQIMRFGTEEQKHRYLPAISRGEMIAAWGLTEPNAGCDSFATQTKAEKTPGGWILNGRKSLITHASFCDVAVVMARTTPEGGRAGISAFIVEKGTPGFTCGKTEDKLGMCASDTGDLVFRDCEVPDTALLGQLHEGGKGALAVLDGGRIGIAALSVGLAQGALDHSLRYAQQREQFGKPIASFQAIQFKLADMATTIQAARLMVEDAARRKDRGERAGQHGSMAKLFASEICVKAAEEAIQIHGGYGYTKDFLVEKYWRDSKLLTIGEGTSEVQRLIIAKNLLTDGH